MADTELIHVDFDGEFWAFEITDLIDGFDQLYADMLLLDVAEQLSELIEKNPGEGILFRSRIEQLMAVIGDSNARSVEFVVADPFVLEQENGIERPVASQLVRINYGSDGGFDFFGLGRVAQAVASIFNGILDYVGKGTERDNARLEAIEKKIEFARKTGASDEQLQAYASELLSKHDRTFRRLIESDRLKEPVKLLPPPENIERREPPKYWL